MFQILTRFRLWFTHYKLRLAEDELNAVQEDLQTLIHSDHPEVGTVIRELREYLFKVSMERNALRAHVRFLRAFLNRNHPKRPA